MRGEGKFGHIIYGSVDPKDTLVLELLANLN